MIKIFVYFFSNQTLVSKCSNFLSYGFMISKLMILSTLYVYELIFITWSLCSFHKSKSLLETLVFCDYLDSKKYADLQAEHKFLWVKRTLSR